MSKPSRSTGNICIILLAVLASIVIIVYALIYSRPAEDDSVPTTGPRAVDTLKFLVVVSRHGNRRSIYSLLNDTLPWNYGKGELTITGRIQAYNLGLKIRRLYNGFLNTLYNSGDVRAASTSLDRTLMSGELFLAGMYPPADFQVWNSHLSWQPIPLYDNSPDKSLSMESVCPRFIQDQLASFRSFELDNADNVSSVNTYLSAHLGINITGAYSMYQVWDVFTCQEGEGFPLPNWVSQVYPQPMKDIIDRISVAKFSGTNTMTRLIVGDLSREILNAMAMKVNGTLTPDRQLYYYSGHDSTLVPLQALLGIPKASMIGLVWPSSSLVLELHQSTEGTFSVEVLYIDGRSHSDNPQTIYLPECGNPCNLDTLIDITRWYTNISNFEQECQLNSSTIL